MARATQIDLPFIAQPSAIPPSAMSGLLFVRHPRARRYVIRVTDDGNVRVTMPRGGSMKEARAFAERERAWIDKQRRRQEEARARRQREGSDMLDASASLEGRERAQQRQRDLMARARRELPPRWLELAGHHGRGGGKERVGSE